MPAKKKPVKAKAKKTTGKQRKGYENIKGQGFHTNPERINKTGRPPKLLKHLNQDLKEKGFEPVKESQIIEAYELLLQLPEQEIKKIALDKNQPYFMRRVIQYFTSAKGMEMMDRILDRSFGRVMHRQTVDATVSIPTPTTDDKKNLALLEEVKRKLGQIDEEAGS